MTDGRPPSDTLQLNAWLKNYAARTNAACVDYISAFVDEKGWLKKTAIRATVSIRMPEATS
jgi:hypothetical protein